MEVRSGSNCHRVTPCLGHSSVSHDFQHVLHRQDTFFGSLLTYLGLQQAISLAAFLASGTWTPSAATPDICGTLTCHHTGPSRNEPFCVVNASDSGRHSCTV